MTDFFLFILNLGCDRVSKNREVVLVEFMVGNQKRMAKESNGAVTINKRRNGVG